MAKREDELNALAVKLGVGNVEVRKGGYYLIPFSADREPRWLGNWTQDAERSLRWEAETLEAEHYLRIGEERYGFSSYYDPEHEWNVREWQERCEWEDWWNKAS